MKKSMFIAAALSALSFSTTASALNVNDTKELTVQALALCPTRELALQVGNECTRIGAHVGLRVAAICVITNMAAGMSDDVGRRFWAICRILVPLAYPWLSTWILTTVSPRVSKSLAFCAS